jgi:hypothetical protein
MYRCQRAEEMKDGKEDAVMEMDATYMKLLS